MHKTQILGGETRVFIGLCVLALVLASVILSIYSSFRMPQGYTQLAWQLNFDRTAVIFSAGFALAISLASNHFQNSAEKQFSAYALIVLSAGGFVLGLVFSWPLLICSFLALAMGGSGFYLSAKLTVTSPASNLILGISLYILFFISVAVYLAAAVFAGDEGGVVLWLLSDASRVGVNGYLALCAIFLISIWLLFADKRELPSLLLLGLSVGLLGPIMFVGWLAPTLVERLGLGDKGHLLVSGLLGGVALVLVATISSLALGGYAPALIVPLGFISIPVILWLSRSPKLGSLCSLLEVTLIVISFSMSLAVVWHLAGFAARLT